MRKSDYDHYSFLEGGVGRYSGEFWKLIVMARYTEALTWLLPFNASLSQPLRPKISLLKKPYYPHIYLITTLLL